MVELKGIPLVLVASILATSLTGCTSNKRKCEVIDTHAHMYVNDEGLVRYVISEKNTLDGYEKSYNYREVSEKESSLYDFMKKNGLLRIDENMDIVLAKQDLNKPFTIYEYSYYSFSRVGSSTHYSWTNDSEHDKLTGKEKDIHYIYQAFRIDKDENGNYILVPSPLVEDINEVSEDYPYIRDNYYIAVDNNNIGVDYQDDLKSKKAEVKETSTVDKTLKKTYE